MTLMPERATSVRAVVIGVEEYEAGSSWALDGPALDAVRVDEWLRDSGVPADRITLLVSALPHNRATLEALGRPVGAPTRAAVYDLFTRQIPADTGDELFVYWGGHGVVDDLGKRRVFCSDASVDDKRNVDFDALRDYLATTAITGFQRQVFVADACQVLAAERRYVSALPLDGWPRNLRAHGREQHALFAACTGEAAENQADPRGGLFTTEVLNDLRQNGIHVSGLDMSALAQRLDRRFTDLRLAGHARQTPAYVWLKTPRTESVVYGLPRNPGRARMSLSALSEVVKAFLEADELASTPARQRMIMTMPADIRAAVDYTGTPREHIIDWLRTCEQFSTGRAALLGVLDLSMSDREAYQRIVDLLDRHWPNRST